MKTLCLRPKGLAYFILFGLIALNTLTKLPAQDCDVPPASPDCEFAPILCSFNEINGFCTTTKPINTFNAPNPLCPQGGSPHNPFWFAFYAGCPNLELFISPTNCGNEGIQAAIYGYGGDGLCPDSQQQPDEFIACMTLPCFNTPQVFVANGLQVGQIYYFMIDGCGGDTCTIEIFVNTDCGPPAIGPWPGLIEGPSPICATGNGTYTVEAPLGGTVFHWYLDGDLIQEGGDNFVNISWPGPGQYTLCVDVSNQCVEEFDVPSQICRTITVYEIIPVDPPPVTICADDTYPYGGNDYPPGVHEVTLKTALYDCDSIVTLTVNGFVVTNAVDPAPVLICEDYTYSYAGVDYPPGTHQVVLDNYMQCDSIITLQINPDPHVTAHLGFFFMCTSDTINIGGQKWFGDPPGHKEIIIKKANPPQCDSTIKFVIDPLYVETYIFPPDILGCFIEETELDGTGLVFNPMDAELEYQWFAYDGGVLGSTPDEPTMTVNTPGKYCLNVKVTSPDGLFSCSDSACVIVTQLDEPLADAWSSGNLSCYVPQVTLTGTSPTPNVNFKWLNPLGIVLTTDTSVVVTTPGNYQFVVTDAVGCPNTVTVEVTADQVPPDKSASTDTITCAQPQVDLVGSSMTPGVSFEWKNALGNVIGTDSITPAPGPGTYNFVVTNLINGCKDSVQITVPVDQILPLPSAGTDTLTCLLPKPPLIGGSNIPNAVYSWSFGGNLYSSQKDTVAAQSGNYILTVFNPVNGCSKDTLITVPENTTPPDAQAIGDSLDCIKTIITLTGSSATPGASFAWLFGGMPIGANPSVQVSNAGIYTLIVTGPNGCTQTTTAEAILDVDIPDLNVIGSDDTISCAVPEILLTGSSSVAVDFLWTNAAGQNLGANATLTIQNAGTYTLTVTNPLNGCSNQTDVTIGQDLAPPVIGVVQGGVIDCIASSINLNATSPTPGVTFQWFTPGNSPLPAGPTPAVSSAGTYTLVLTGYNGCTSSQQATVTASPDLPQNVVASDNGPITCTNTNVQIDVTSSTAGVVYQWTGPGGFTCTNPSCAVLVPGTYNVTVTNPANGCTVTDFTVVSIDTIHPVLVPTGNLITCYDPAVSISVASQPTANVTYLWTDPNNLTTGGNNASVTAAISGNWTVMVTNTVNGCASSTVVPVTENTLAPMITIPAPATLTCTAPSASITPSVNTSVNYLWSGPGINAGNQQVASPSVTLPGTYNVTITDPINGCTNTASTTVQEDKANPQVVLPGGELTCTNPTFSLTGTVTPTTGITAQWFLDNNPIPGSTTALPVSMSGTYTLQVTNTVNGCTSQAQAMVISNQDDPDIAATGGEVTCLAPTLTLAGSSMTSGATFGWSGPNSFTAVTAITQVNVPGSYQFTVTAPNGCTSQLVVSVTEDKDLPTAVASSALLIDCTNPTTTLLANGSSAGTGISYSWTDPAGNVIGTGLTLPGISVIGAYTLTVFNALNGCSADAMVQVEDNPNKPTGMETLVENPRCFGQKNGQIQILGVNGGTPPFLYSLNGGPFGPQQQFGGLGEGSYVLTVQDAAGCVYSAPAIVVSEPSQLTVELGEDFILQWGRDTFLYALITPPDALISSIQWTPAGVDTTLNSNEILIKPFNQTLYGVVVTDTAGCRAEDKVLVLVEKRRPVYIPNVFAPTGDQNTRFYIQSGTGITEIEVFEVYNRWGEQVYRNANFQPNDPSEGWDGSIRNRPANPEVFVYFAKIRFDDGITILYKGDVTLVR
jgi:hypothetical protein